MAKRHIKLYFLRWYFSYNVGDSIMLSCLFRAIKEVYAPCTLEVISDETIMAAFYNDPHVDRFRLPSRLEKAQPKRLYQKGPKTSSIFSRDTLKLVIWPEWRKEAFAYLADGGRLKECIDSPFKNIISYNYALQVGPEIAGFEDLRPRIYLTDPEVEEAGRNISPNSIAINMARIRTSQSRTDNETLRYRLSSWKRFVGLVKEFDPSITVYELGQEEFLGVGDEFIPNTTIREAAAALNAMRLVVLSDGGVHNICNAIDKKVLLFQGYEWNPPDLFKMGNAIFNESYHPGCRKECHLFSDILGVKSRKDTCARECYELDPDRLAGDCIGYLKEHGLESRV